MLIFSHMRIPWYIYAPLGLLVTCVTLFIYINDKDFHKNSTPEKTTESLREWRKDNLSLKDTQLINTPANLIEVDTRLIPKSRSVKPQHQPIKLKSSPVLQIPDISPALNSLARENLCTLLLNSDAEQMLKNNFIELAGRHNYSLNLLQARCADMAEPLFFRTREEQVYTKQARGNPIATLVTIRP